MFPLIHIVVIGLLLSHAAAQTWTSCQTAKRHADDLESQSQQIAENLVRGEFNRLISPVKFAAEEARANRRLRVRFWRTRKLLQNHFHS